MTRFRTYLAASRTTRWLTALAGVALLSAAGTAQATPVTFAQYSQVSASNDLTYTPGATSATLVTNHIGGTAVNFSFLVPVAGLSGPQSAHVVITTTTTAPAQQNNVLRFVSEAINVTSTITITRDTPYAGKTNLLTVVFNNGVISGQRFGSSANLGDSTNSGGTVTFTSDFLSFSNTTQRALTLAMSSLISPGPGSGGLQKSGTFLRAFTASGTGSFSSDPAPIVTIPEPATIALVGLGLIGLPVAFRRRRLTTAVTE